MHAIAGLQEVTIDFRMLYSFVALQQCIAQCSNALLNAVMLFVARPHTPLELLVHCSSLYKYSCKLHTVTHTNSHVSSTIALCVLLSNFSSFCLMSLFKSLHIRQTHTHPSLWWNLSPWICKLGKTQIELTSRASWGPSLQGSVKGRGTDYS